MSSGQVYKPWERHHNDELRVPSDEYVPNKPFVKKEKIIFGGSFNAVYIYWCCFETGSRAKQRKASSNKEIQVFAISSCLQVESANRDYINIINKERSLLTRTVRKRYRHRKYVRSYKTFLFFRAPSVCDDRCLLLLQDPYSVSKFLFFSSRR
jgi:hypothetical protein